MSRCKACNAFMSEEDMCRKFPPNPDGTRDYSNLCGDCHEISVAVLFNYYHEPEYDNIPLFESRTMSKVPE